jgi:hypothetical protein
MKRLLPWCVFACFCLSFARGPGAAHAAGVLSVVIAPPQTRLLPILNERFSRRRWDANIEQRRSVQLTGVATEDSSTLKVFVDLQTPGWARLVFVQPGGQRFSIRDLSFAQGLDEVAFETIGLVVDSAVDSLFSGLGFELSRNDAEAALQKAPSTAVVTKPPAHVSVPVAPSSAVIKESATAPQPEQVSVWRPFVAAGYTASPQGSESLAWLSGPTLLASQHSQKFMMQLELSWMPSTQIKGTVIGGEITGGSSRASWGLYRQRGSLAFCAMPVRLGVDVTKLHPQVEQPTLNAMAAAPRTFFSPVIGTMFGGFWSASPSVTVAAYFSADLDVLGTNFSITSNGNRETVAGLWRVRPALTVVLGWGG